MLSNIKFNTYDGRLFYNLIFNDNQRSRWIHRVSESEDISDPKLTKKSISYDINIPVDIPLIASTKPYSNILSAQKILPLFIISKGSIKNIDTKISNTPISISTKDVNKKVKESILSYLENSIIKKISTLSIKPSKLNSIEKIKKISKNSLSSQDPQKYINDIIDEILYLNPLSNSTINNIKETLGKYINCHSLLHDAYIFSVILPNNISAGSREIIKIYYELPSKANSLSINLKWQQDIEKVVPLESFSRHVNYILPEGLQAINYRISTPLNPDGENIDVSNNSLYYKEKQYIDSKNDNSKPLSKDSSLKFDVIPVRQGIRRWAFWISFITTTGLLMSAIIRLYPTPDGFYTRTLPTASIIITFTALIISWFSRSQEPPLTELIRSKIKLILVIQAGALYSSAALIAVSPHNIWVWSWFLIYTISMIANIYAVYLNYYWAKNEGVNELLSKYRKIYKTLLFTSILISFSLAFINILLLFPHS